MTSTTLHFATKAGKEGLSTRTVIARYTDTSVVAFSHMKHKSMSPAATGLKALEVTQIAYGRKEVLVQGTSLKMG